jgi:UDP-N-acetyl-D-mannosaminuronate dehydrogenase
LSIRAFSSPQPPTRNLQTCQLKFIIRHSTSGKSSFEGNEPDLAELIHRVAVEKGSFRVTDDYAVCAEADVILIDVQTPADAAHVPHYESLREVSAEAGRHLQSGALVIIESTVAPGATRHVLRPGRAGAVTVL